MPGSRKLPQSSGRFGKRDRCNSRHASVTVTGTPSKPPHSVRKPAAQPRHVASEARRCGLRPKPPAAVAGKDNHARQVETVAAPGHAPLSKAERCREAGLFHGTLRSLIDGSKRVSEEARAGQSAGREVVGRAASLDRPFLRAQQPHFAVSPRMRPDLYAE